MGWLMRCENVTRQDSFKIIGDSETVQNYSLYRGPNRKPGPGTCNKVQYKYGTRFRGGRQREFVGQGNEISCAREKFG